MTRPLTHREQRMRRARVMLVTALRNPPLIRIRSNPMSQDRRAFLQLSLATGAAFAAGSMPAFARAMQGKAKQSLNMLVLGGTAFLGPAIVRCATERGHKLTLFNRNKTRTDLFPDIERLQ